MAKSIVFSICEQHKVLPDEFFGRSRSQRLAACRRDAIIALREAGMSVEACAKLVKRNISTAHYWLKPHNRAHRKASMLARKAWKRMDHAVI